MFETHDNIVESFDLDDIPPAARWLLFALLILIMLSLGACCTPKPIEPVKRHSPSADMVTMPALPMQTDPSLGGLFKGYASAAQQYRGCVDRLTELQDWVKSGQ